MDQCYLDRRAKSIMLLTAATLLVLSGLLWLSVPCTILADLPPVSAIEARAVRPTTRILDRNGRLLYEVLDPNAGKQLNLRRATGPQAGHRYGLASVPDFCIEATLATEDSRFFLHPGV